MFLICIQLNPEAPLNRLNPHTSTRHNQPRDFALARPGTEPTKVRYELHITHRSSEIPLTGEGPAKEGWLASACVEARETFVIYLLMRTHEALPPFGKNV